MRFNKLWIVFILIIAFILRLFNISNNPPGLYIDEVAIGNNAYEILKSGKDEHGETFPMFFKSFGDYKMPVYIYAVSGSMAIFGKNEFAVRFPSAFFGSLTVLLMFLFVKKIAELDKVDNNYKNKLPLISAFLLAISPWHLQFSRGGFETNLALFIFMIGALLFLYFALKQRFYFLPLSSFFFALSIYTYHSYRLIAPLFFLFALLIFYIKYKIKLKEISLSFIFFLILCLPILIFTFSPEGSARFSATSVFSELGTLTLAEKISQYPLAILRNYLSYFSFYFLFDVGDQIGRHQIPNFGPMFKWQLPFLLAGLYFLFRKRMYFLITILIGLVIVSPMAASLAVPSPHTLRSLLLVIPLSMIVSIGLLNLLNKFKNGLKYALLALSIAITLEFLHFAHYYSIHYPLVNSLDWGGGYKELVLVADDFKKDYDHVILDKNLTFAPYYFEFYSDSLRPDMVDVSWQKPTVWKDDDVLYIRPNYGSNSPDIVRKIMIGPHGSEVFAELWKL